MNPLQMLLGAGIGVIILLLLIGIFMIISMWKVFAKAGQPGWAVLIPIYREVVWLTLVNKPIWWIILLLIPFVNIVIVIMILHRTSLSFGKDGGFTAGLFFLPIIFWPILAFGKAEYKKLEN